MNPKSFKTPSPQSQESIVKNKTNGNYKTALPETSLKEVTRQLDEFRRLNDFCRSRPDSPSKRKSFHLGLSNLIKYLQYDFQKKTFHKKISSLGDLERAPHESFKKKNGFVSIREVDSTPREKYLMVKFLSF